MSGIYALAGDRAALLRPVVALNVWTLTMEVWMYALRIPALKKYNINTDPEGDLKGEMQKLPPSIRWKADNYNHLHEQPTAYYAIALTLALIGANDKLTKRLAWGYVGLRIVHSLVQSTVNNIPVRFSIFGASSITLAAMTAKAAMLLLE